MESTIGTDLATVKPWSVGQSTQFLPEEAPCEELSLNDVLGERKGLYQQLCGEIAIATRLATNLDLLCAPLIEIERLLLNLVLLAKHQMPFGGYIRFETANVITEDGESRRWVKLALESQRNVLGETSPVGAPKYWDAKLAQKIITDVISARGGMLTVCQLSEALSITEILLPAKD